MSQVDSAGVLEVPTSGAIDADRVAAARVLVYNARGARPPLVAIRTWSTEGEHFRALARALGPDQPIHSIAPPDFATLAEYPQSTDAWVDWLMPQLEALRIEGPWLLGGWSFGGVVALEAGERLAAAGKEIALVLMLDTRKPRARPETKPGVRMPVRLRKLGRQLVEYASLETRAERFAYLRERLDPIRAVGKARARRSRRAERETKKRAKDEARGEGARTAAGAPAEGLIVTRWTGERMSFLERTIHVVYLKYRGHATTLPIALFRTRESMERHGDDPALGWWPFARGRFAIEEVEGTHWTIFDPAHVERLAVRVERVLREALEALSPAGRCVPRNAPPA